MSFLLNWKIYLAFAGVLVLFYFMYTAKLSEIATVKAENKTLTETVKAKDTLLQFRDSFIEFQDKILADSRKEITEKNKKLGELNDKVEKRKDAEEEASPYLKEYFKELGNMK